MNKIAKRIFSLMLGLLLAVSVFPMTATAALSNYEDGKLLIKMSSLDPSAVLVNRIGASISTTADAKAKRDTKDTTKILANGSDNETYGGIGLTTDLPLTGDTAYTIEYYAKVTDPSKGMGMFFGFCHNAKYPYYGADFYAYADGKHIETHSKWWNNGWYKKDSDSDRYGKTLDSSIWTSNAGADGFVRFVMTFDGRYMSLKIDGTDLGLIYDMDRPATTNFKSVDEWELKTLCLQAGFTGVGVDDEAIPRSGDCIVELKDISIYSGIVDPDDVPDPKFVTFKGIDGKIIKSTEIENGSLTLQSFPDVTAESQLVWVNEKTGAIAEAPMTVTSDTTLRAYDIGKNESKTLGVQYGAVSGGKQDIRFIGGIFGTSGSGVGFEIVAKYKEGDSLKTATYKGAGNTVYTSITATENGTLKNATAKELGAYYVYGIVIEDVPTDIGQIDFTVKSYKEVGKNKIRIYGEPVTVSFKDGALDSTLAPLS